MRDFFMENGFIKVRKRGGKLHPVKEVWFRPEDDIYFSLSKEGAWSVATAGPVDFKSIDVWRQKFHTAMKEKLG
jgi:hypothetical protein